MVTVVLWRDGKLYNDGTIEEFAKHLRAQADDFEKWSINSSGAEAHLDQYFRCAAEVIESLLAENKELEERFWFRPEVSDDYSLGWSDGYSDGLNASENK